ncbi:MAG: CBS domain-containing protein [Sulfurimicrobium sp.]|jgi:CBS domain-containing protein|nr:CBS domain-containing protein [Sulfurimicrobium sp.]MDP1704627.1 CBS domain-containing protein [Sulfurimicrobium sp.]MDP2197170.1 CBS domain-containing protein [Sulfurimicrobium sp.]MDP2963249.1 CBS domain-containing protein [Sulfurimicrobium sp.]MDP3688774.1 CBS domain-containing protein [Sulfurimicrobium sp.]
MSKGKNMIANQIRDILVPLADFPHITHEASIRDAFAVLQNNQQTAGWRFRHLLVLDAQETLVGILGIRDLLRALMPGYLKATTAQHVAGALPDDTSLSILWQDSFVAQCRQMNEVRVGSYMTPVRCTVQAGDPLTRAAYLMISHEVNMLPVLDGRRVVGVVRIVDVFNQAATEVLHD